MKVLGDETLRAIAQELVEALMKQNLNRLGRAGERPGPDEARRPQGSPEARVSAGQAGKGDPDGDRAGRVTVRRMGERIETKKWSAPFGRTKPATSTPYLAQGVDWRS